MFSEHSPVQLEFYNVLKNSKLQLKGEIPMFLSSLKNFFFSHPGNFRFLQRQRRVCPHPTPFYSLPSLPTKHRVTIMSTAIFTLPPPDPNSRARNPRVPLKTTGSRHETTVVPCPPSTSTAPFWVSRSIFTVKYWPLFTIAISPRSLRI